MWATDVIELFVIMSKFVVSAGLINGPILDQVNWFVHSERSIVAHVVPVSPVGRLVTRDASMFPPKPDSVTPTCVEDIHDGIFARDVQSAVPPVGRFVIRLASKFPKKLG